MPAGKQKTRKSVSKRFTKSLKRQKAAHSHRLVPKSKGSKNAYAKKQTVHKSDAKNIKRALFI
jgi:ribosomal protein L35